MFELIDNVPQSAVIKVVGVGGGGGNAVKAMISAGVEGVEFICANTDAQALSGIPSRTVLQLGAGITKGLGAGANPEVGRQAARGRLADLDAGRRERLVQRLHVGVGGDELHAAQSGADHAIDGVAASAADPDHLEPGRRGAVDIELEHGHVSLCLPRAVRPPPIGVPFPSVGRFRHINPTDS